MKTIIYILSAGLFVLAPTSAQQTSKPGGAKAKPPVLTNLLPKDDPALYRQFFYFHDSLTNWLSGLKANKSAIAVADLDNKAAAGFALTAAGYAQMTAVTAAVARELRAIDQAQAGHANERAHYEQPPLVWTATQSYINGEFRGGIRVK